MHFILFYYCLHNYKQITYWWSEILADIKTDEPGECSLLADHGPLCGKEKSWLSDYLEDLMYANTFPSQHPIVSVINSFWIIKLFFWIVEDQGMLLNQALAPPAFWYVSVSPGKTLVSDWTFGIIARIVLITELFWAENVGLGYFPQLIFGVNRTESVTAAPNTDPRLQLGSLEEQLQFPDGVCFEVGSLGLSDLHNSMPPSLRILEEWGSLLAGTGCASPLADGPWGCSQLAALGAAHRLLRAMLGLAWNQLQDWWAVTGSSWVAVSLLPSQSQLGTAEDLAHSLVLAIDYLSLVMEFARFIPSRE